MRTLGEKIRELRKKKGLSQEELAFEIDISRQTVSKWESDSMQPTTENIRALCDFFEVTSEYFIGEDRSTTVAETVATKADMSEKSETKAITNKGYSRKKILILVLLISLSAIIFVSGVLLGGISIYNLTIPHIGFDDHYASSADVLAAVGIILALAALATAIILIILLKRDKKRKMESFVDKM